MGNELIAILNTLNSIEVKGKDNIDKLLGCIIKLEQIIQGESEKQDGR